MAAVASYEKTATQPTRSDFNLGHSENARQPLPVATRLTPLLVSRLSRRLEKAGPHPLV